MKIIIIDGQGGRIGKSIVEQLKKVLPNQPLIAIGTNSTATSAMLKAGADLAATGENPVLVNSRDADIIIGPLGIVIANSLLGEITPAMAEAVGSSKALQILLPVNRCNHYVVGTEELTLTDAIRQVCQKVISLCSGSPDHC